MANTLLPAPISVSGGNLQSTSVSTQFATSLSVTVKDGSGTPVGAQLPVTFTVVPDPVTGASGTFADSGTQNTTAVNTATELTNASGLATAPPFSADSTVGGPYTVTVTTVDGDAATATIVNLYNTRVPATITSAPTSSTAAPISAPINTAFPALTVTVMDGSTPPVPVQGAVVTFTAPAFTVTTTGTPPVTTISASSGTFADSGTVTTTAVTDVNGMAQAATFTANGLANAAGATYNVTASVVVKSGTTLSTNSETPTQNFVLTNTP
jgi:hypothetical protein